MNTAILFVTHIYNEDIKRQMSSCMKKPRTCHVVCRLSGRQGKNHVPDSIRPFPFTVKELNRLEYRSWGCTLMDGNFHFVMLDFYLKHAGYDYYWLIEYDVRFNGDWKKY